MWTILEKLEKIQFDNYMSEKFKQHLFEAKSFCGALCFLVMLLWTNTISNPLQISVLDSALRSEYPEVYPPGSEPGFTRNKVFFKLNGDDPDQIRLSLDSSRNELNFDSKILEALEGLILPELYETVKAKQSKEGVTLSSLQEIGLPVQMGKHALIMIPVPEDKKHPNQRPPRTKDNVPPVLAKESEELNKQLVANWSAPAASVALDSSAWRKAVATPPTPFRLKLDSLPLGETVLEWNADSSEFSFRSPQFAETVGIRAPPAEKNSITGKDGWFNTATLKQANLQVSLDKDHGEINISSPDSWRTPITEEPPQLAALDTTPVDYSKLSKDELFSRIFKKAPPPRMRDIMVKLYTEGEDLEQVKVMWNPAFSSFTFFSKRLRHYLDTCLTPVNRKKVNGLDGNFSSTRLVESGFTVELDEAEFVLHIQIPPSIKQLQRHRMDEQMEDELAGTKLEPAIFSAYLNAYMYQDFYYSERIYANDSAKARYEAYNGQSEPERLPFSADLDGAIRLKDFVLQSTAEVNEPLGRSWDKYAIQRNETQLIRDFINLNSRLTIGDISPRLPHSNFSSPKVGGVRHDGGGALNRENSGDGNQVAFQLPRAAKVDVYVNGSLQKSYQLSSGDHIIDGFSGQQGTNVIELQVTYEDGFRQTIPFEFQQAAPMNLSNGENQGNVSWGVRRIDDSWNPKYRYESSSDRVFTGRFSRGLTYNLTATIFGGFTTDLQVIGGNLSWSPDTTRQWEVTQTVSYTKEHSVGMEQSISLSKRLGTVSTRTYGARTEKQFRNAFLSLTDEDPRVKYLLGFSAGSNIWKGSANMYLNANFNYRDSAVGAVDYSLGASYSARAFRSLNLSAAASISIAKEMSNPMLTFTASYFFNRGNHSGYVIDQLQSRKTFLPPKMKSVSKVDSNLAQNGLYTDSLEYVPGVFENRWKNMTNFGWSWSNGMGVVDGSSYSANASFITVNEYNARLSYQHTSNFGSWSSSYSVNDQRNRQIMARSHYLSTQFGTSLMFADGLWGLGRPVYGGFVLTKGQHELANTEVRINPSEQYNSEYSHSLGPMSAGYGQLSPYSEETIQLKLSNPPIGAYLEENRYKIENTYKQGYALRIGLPPRVFIRVRLLDESMSPVSYTTFQVFEKGNTTKQPIHQSFTNKSGVLQAADLKAGNTYIIRFGEDAFIKEIELRIPESARGIFDFGDVKVEHEVLASKLAALQNKAQNLE